jgi:ATP-dependent Clp protease ATP-binding subunit ClpC
MIVFHVLNHGQIRQIVDLMIAQLNKRLKDNNLQVDVTDAAKDILAKTGFDEVYGARPLRRAIQNIIEDQMSEGLLAGEFGPGDAVVAEAADDQIRLRKK